jgi:hypothetical protein
VDLIPYGRRVADEFSAFGDLLTGSYDCVDRIVLNAYFPLAHNPGGFRTWWRRLHDGSDEQSDDAHLMRMAGRFAPPGQGLGPAQRRCRSSSAGPVGVSTALPRRSWPVTGSPNRGCCWFWSPGPRPRGGRDARSSGSWLVPSVDAGCASSRV